METSPRRRRTRSDAFPIVCDAGSIVVIGTPTESYAVFNTLQTRSIGKPTAIRPDAVIGCVSTVVIPMPPAPERRTVSCGLGPPGEEVAAPFAEAQPTSARHERTLNRRTVHLPNEWDRGRYETGGALSSRPCLTFIATATLFLARVLARRERFGSSEYSRSEGGR
jgi:hypothetical protein